MAFIVFEGIDHSGKSTLVKLLSIELKKHAIDFIVTREPGGTPTGEKIRNLILNSYEKEMSPQTEILLISANRRDHIDKVIAPALKKQGKWIICDRFWPSTFAFQVAGSGIPKKDAEWLNQFVIPKQFDPDLYILLDMSVDEKEKRSHFLGTPSDRFERQDRAFHQRVREEYLSLAKTNKKQWLTLNSLLPTHELMNLIMAELKRRKWLNF